MLLLLKSSQILRAAMAAHMMAFANVQVSLGLLTTHGQRLPVTGILSAGGCALCTWQIQRCIEGL